MPAYADIGKNAKDLMVGNPKSGAFTYDSKLSFASTTSNGVAFAVNAIKKADKVDGTLKIAYVKGKYAVDTTVDPAGKVTVSASLANALAAAKVPGVKLSLAAALPDVSSAKLTADYAPCKEFSIKSTVALQAAPVVDISAAAMYKDIYIGGETGYDTAKSLVTKYNVVIGYHAPDYQVAAYVTDMGANAKLAYAHNINASTTVGAEVARALSGTGATAFTLAYAKKLDSGAFAKIKLDNSGVLSTLYETKLASGEKVAGSLQLKATDLSQPVKYGFALDLC